MRFSCCFPSRRQFPSTTAALLPHGMTHSARHPVARLFLEECAVTTALRARTRYNHRSPARPSGNGVYHPTRAAGRLRTLDNVRDRCNNRATGPDHSVNRLRDNRPNYVPGADTNNLRPEVQAAQRRSDVPLSIRMAPLLRVIRLAKSGRIRASSRLCSNGKCATIASPVPETS